MARKALMGHKIRRLRRREGLTQAQMARQLGISASYLNLIEHDQRSLTVPLLLKLGTEFGVEVADFAEDDERRLTSDLSEVFGDALFEDEVPGSEELGDVVRAAPGAARGVIKLYRAWRGARERVEQLLVSQAGEDVAAGEVAVREPAAEVSDFIQEHDNHFPALEDAADRLRAAGRLDETGLLAGLEGHLSGALEVRVRVATADDAGVMRRYDADRRELVVSEVLAPRSRVFQLAHQICLIEHGDLLATMARSPLLSSDPARALARVALANYFAGAVLMPYAPFADAARQARYDIERLGHRFRTSFEQVCHRLTTLGRKGHEGVPFHLIRVDIAGNISKRFSASGIRFARYGGACPRWNVFSAFLQPGFIRTQVSRMPDGSVFFCMARTVRREGGGYSKVPTRFAIGLGCSIDHAHELVYVEGVDLKNSEAAVPIGTACRLCERLDCQQRAFPPMQQRFDVDENVRRASFYTQ